MRYLAHPRVRIRLLLGRACQNVSPHDALTLGARVLMLMSLHLGQVGVVAALALRAVAATNDNHAACARDASEQHIEKRALCHICHMHTYATCHVHVMFSPSLPPSTASITEPAAWGRRHQRAKTEREGQRDRVRMGYCESLASLGL